MRASCRYSSTSRQQGGCSPVNRAGLNRLPSVVCTMHYVYTNVYMLYMYTSYERARVQCTAIVPRAKRTRNCDTALTSNHDAIDPSLLQAPLCISQELYVAISKHWNVHTASARSRCRNEHYLINSYKY